MCRHLGVLRKTTARKIHCERLMQQGATVIEYLMLTAVVAGVVVPIVLNVFGGPLQQVFKKNRQTLVQFIAQDRKQSVPYPWFSQERPADINVSESKEIGKSEVGESPNIAESPEIRVNELGSSKVGSAGVGQGGARGTGPADGGLLDSNRVAKKTTGASSSATDDSSLSDSFFKGERTETGSRDEKAEETGTLYGRAGEVAPETKAAEEEGVAGKEWGSEKDREEKGRGLSETKRKQGALMAEIEERERLKKSTFSWWFLLKILILLLIIFLILLILLSNMRRR